MARINLSFNGTQKDLDDFCTSRGYRNLVSTFPPPDFVEVLVPNPESKIDFFTRTIQEWVWGLVKSQRAKIAGDSARLTEINKNVNF